MLQMNVAPPQFHYHFLTFGQTNPTRLEERGRGWIQNDYDDDPFHKKNMFRPPPRDCFVF
jgi:hypothetical protein